MDVIKVAQFYTFKSYNLSSFIKIKEAYEFYQQFSSIK